VATVSISVSYTGADPQTMADQVAKPIENTLTTISGVNHITTNASQGTAQMTVEFATRFRLSRRSRMCVIRSMRSFRGCLVA